MYEAGKPRTAPRLYPIGSACRQTSDLQRFPTQRWLPPTSPNPVGMSCGLGELAQSALVPRPLVYLLAAFTTRLLTPRLPLRSRRSTATRCRGLDLASDKKKREKTRRRSAAEPNKRTQPCDVPVGGTFLSGTSSAHV